jgi:hypothetical protein
MRIFATENDLDNTSLLENILRKKNTPLKLFKMLQRPCSICVIKISNAFERRLDDAGNGWDYFNLTRVR